MAKRSRLLAGVNQPQKLTPRKHRAGVHRLLP
jgi:hypothetical protein